MTNLHDMSRRLHGVVELLKTLQEAVDDSPTGDSLFALYSILTGIDEELRQAAEDALTASLPPVSNIM
jgi:hypothetical protein